MVELVSIIVCLFLSLGVAVKIPVREDLLASLKIFAALSAAVGFAGTLVWFLGYINSAVAAASTIDEIPICIIRFVDLILSFFKIWFIESLMSFAVVSFICSLRSLRRLLINEYNPLF